MEGLHIFWSMLTFVAKSKSLFFLGSCLRLLARNSLISFADMPIIGSLELVALPLVTGLGWAAGWAAGWTGFMGWGAGGSTVPLVGAGVGAGAGDEPSRGGFESLLTLGDELDMEISFFLK